MKKTSFTDVRRLIIKQIISFLSIIVIAAMAVTAYLGISFSSNALYKNAENFYRDHNFRDFEVISTMLLSRDDLEAIRNTEGIADAEGEYDTQARLVGPKTSQNVNVVSLTERINRVRLKEGALPSSGSECVLEEEMMEKLGLKIGDTINLNSGDGKAPKYLKDGRFLITGTVIHPDHYAKVDYVPGNRYVLVQPEAFDEKALEDHLMKALVVIEKPAGMGVYDKEYYSLCSEIESRLEELSKPRAAKRDKEIRDQADEKIREAEEKLAKAKKKLDDGRKKLDENWQKLSQAEREAANGKQLLDEGKAQLDAAASQLEQARPLLEAGKVQLDSAKSQLDAATSLLTTGFLKAEEIKTRIRNILIAAVTEVIGEEEAGKIRWAEPNMNPNLDDPGLTISEFRITDKLVVTVEDYKNLQALVKDILKLIRKNIKHKEEFDKILELIRSNPEYRKLKRKFRSVLKQLEKWDTGHAEYLAGKAKYLEGEAAYAEKLAQYEQGLAAYEEGLAQYNAKFAEYESGLAQIESGRKTLEKGEKKYEKGLKKYQKGERKLEKGKKDLEELASCRWLILDVNSNGGYLHGKNSAENIGKLSMTFALLFVLIGALVIYVTVGRIIEEQRRLVGAQKALGFFSSEIRMKYLVFGMTATFLGMLLGAVLQYLVVQPIVLNVHSLFYVTDTIARQFRWGIFAIVLVIGVVLSAIAVWIACRRLLKETAKSLMAAKMPGKNQKAAKKKDSGKSLYYRLILRNMLENKGRVIVTTISIAGCCILLMIGFTLRFNVEASINGQFSEYVHYSGTISFDPSVSKSVEEDVETFLKNNNAEYMKAYFKYQGGDFKDRFTFVSLICTENDEIGTFYSLRDVTTGAPLSLPDSGVIIMKRTAETNGISVGDSITLYDDVMEPHEAKVAGIAQMYFGQDVIFSGAAYEEIFGKKAEKNIFYYMEKDGGTALAEELEKIPGVTGITSLGDMVGRYRSVTNSLNMVTLVLILAAGVMAYFILMNLINMYLAQEKLELTVMRINGYTSGEVIRYSLMESVFTTVFGILLGLVAGGVLGFLILRLLEQPHAGFVHSVSWAAVGIAAGMTALFSFVINTIALQKVKKLNLTDIE